MKSPDDRIDEELRKALKSRFDNFESLPDASLSERIFKAISGGSNAWRKGLIGGLLLLITGSAALFFGSLYVEKGNKTVSEPKAAASGPGVALVVKKQEHIADNVPESKSTAMQPGAGQVKKNRVRSEKDVRGQKGVRRQMTHAEVVKLIETVKSNPSFGSIWFRDGDLSESDKVYVQNQMQALSRDVPTATDSSGQEETKALEGRSVVDQDIGVLDHRPLALPQFAWPPDSLITPGKLKKRYDLKSEDRWGIIVGITPLRTYQLLTVRSGNGVTYQNFALPTKISAETLGFKFSAGVEKKGFQVMLNYGQFRQSYRYEIATDEYLVGKDPSGNYNVVRQGISQEENSTVRLLGVSIKKHTVRRSPFLRNYYGDVGGEFSRDLSSGKNMVWLNAGFGKELFAGRNTTLTVGPYVEYSLMKLNNPDNPFRIQPYQIGLSVGLRFMKK
jgi:hypothetical protein